MQIYRSKKRVLLPLDMMAITVSYMTALSVRYTLLIESFGSVLVVPSYASFFAIALVCYILAFFFRDKPRLERKSDKEIIIQTLEEQIIFIMVYVSVFFIFHRSFVLSGMIVGMFFLLNVLYCSLIRIFYHNYCLNKINEMAEIEKKKRIDSKSSDVKQPKGKQHVYIVGSKSIGQYGGYESFIMNLLQQHKSNKFIKYHIACKANGAGYMNLSKLLGANVVNDYEFDYCNAHCFMIKVPEKLGSAQAIYYDLAALKWCCNHIEKNHIENPIVYILASRVGPFEKKYVEKIRDFGGKIFQNPDGWEYRREKWSLIIRMYWKISEKYAIKNADLVVCDSKHIEEYIKDEYFYYKPKTTFIAYGSYVEAAVLADDNPKYTNWLSNHNLVDGEYYICVGRFVPENNFEVMIREFMTSHTKKDFVIITTRNDKYAARLQCKLQYKRDKRIKFVGTVYDPELLSKIRSNAYAYIHGHEVGGTNPSLLEALGTTNLNLLFDVGFNREVGEDAALYWNKEERNLATLIDIADALSKEEIVELGAKAKKRIRDAYSWKYIADLYLDIFVKSDI